MDNDQLLILVETTNKIKREMQICKNDQKLKILDNQKCKIIKEYNNLVKALN